MILDKDKKKLINQLLNIQYHIWDHIIKILLKEKINLLIHYQVVNSKLIKLNNLLNISNKILYLKLVRKKRNKFNKLSENKSKPKESDKKNFNKLLK